jgi:pimeloyl-ACP methyl ester carboxylesterase
MEHSAKGSADTMRGVQRERPSLFDLEESLRTISTPALIMTGDEDEPCLLPNIYLKRVIPSAALVVLPNSGHTINIEEPDLFNRNLDEFFTQVGSGRWPMRDERSMSGSILGMADEQ